MKTVGGHCRIPISEAISFYETFHREKTGVTTESLCHCWEYPQKANCDKDCKNCLLYESRINYCFIVVREFGKEVIHCKGNCLNCDYFEEFFSSYSESERLNETYEAKTEEAAANKKNLLYDFAYRVGRSVQEVKGKVTGIKKAFGSARASAKQTENSNA
jgi:hypothetical protein